MPSDDDLPWLVSLVGSRTLLFLGDLDPVDLLVYAWLRSRPQLARVEFLGIGDEMLAESKHANLRSIRMQLSDEESQTLPHLETALGAELAQVVGDEAAGILRQGNKVEIEGIFCFDAAAGARVVRWIAAQC